MYQGSNKTACASQRQFAEALLELMAEQPFDQLTVSAICKRAGISRATFYTLFQSKENVVTYLLMQDCCDTPSEECAEADVLRALCHGYSEYVVRQAELLRLLSENHIMQLLQGTLSELFCSCECFRACLREEMMSYVPDYVAAGLTSIAESSIREGADQQTIERISYKMLRGEFLI